MFDSTSLIIEAATHRLIASYRHVFRGRDPDRAAAIAATTRLALERIGLSDAPYHDVEHTVMVTLVGTEILRGREIAEPLSPDDWLHMTVALLCHDIGYVRGACRGDTATEAVVDSSGQKVALPRGASDAWLTPYHVDRSKIFVRERAARSSAGLDPERVARGDRADPLPGAGGRGSRGDRDRSRAGPRRRPDRPARGPGLPAQAHCAVPRVRRDRDGGSARLHLPGRPHRELPALLLGQDRALHRRRAALPGADPGGPVSGPQTSTRTCSRSSICAGGWGRSLALPTTPAPPA